MTSHKHLKQLVRARMSKTGEAYATARRQILTRISRVETDGPHRPGCDPATTALRIALTSAGIHSPVDGQPFTEALLFLLAGGVGIGVFSFFYEKDDFASFFLGSRHRWHDHTEYLKLVVRRLGAEAIVTESAGVRQAAQDLRRMLDEHGVCIAWVDASLLPHRGLPPSMGGMAYHVITVYGVDEAAGTASIGDLTDHPLTIALEDLAGARARIRKDRNRLLAVRRAGDVPPLDRLVRQGLEACHAGLDGDGAPQQARRNFRLDALDTWARRMKDPTDRESWARVFARGPRLWQGLSSIHEYIEYYGTGGGLARPHFAAGLEEAAQCLRHDGLAELATRYHELGRQWSDLAETALPADVEPFNRLRLLREQRAEVATASEHDAAERAKAVWSEIAALTPGTARDFPLPADAADQLVRTLADRVSALHAAETGLRDEIPRIAHTLA